MHSSIDCRYNKGWARAPNCEVIQMNTRAFSLALILAAVAMWMVYAYVDAKLLKYKQEYGEEQAVAVANSDVEEMALLDSKNVTTTKVPKKFVAPGAYTNIEDLANTIATTPFRKGEQITATRVTYPGAQTGLARQVSNGKRAFSLLVTPEMAVGRLIKPGDRVDVIASIDYSSGRSDLIKVQTVLQDVLVLSTGYSITNSIPIYGKKSGDNDLIKKMNANVFEDFTNVTLELEPYQVQKLLFIKEHMNARPYLSLRNNNDKSRKPIPPTDVFDVLGADQGEAKRYFEERYRKK